MPTMKGVSVSSVLAVVLAFYVGSCNREPAETVVITRVDTVPYAAFRDSLKSERMESSGLRAKLAGREEMQPNVIIRTDTLVTPPDTVLSLVSLDGNGNLSLAPLIRSDSLWAPEIHRFDVGNCDDGFSWASGQLVCDRARWGHLGFTVAAGASYPIWGGSYPTRGPSHTKPTAWLGIEWTPSYRSAWRASIQTDPSGRLAATITRKWLVVW